jgi:hypothetical protein
MPLIETVGSSASRGFGQFGSLKRGSVNGQVVTSGLYIYMDPVNTSSYNGSGTTVYDLSGNGRHGSMTNMSSSNWVTINGYRAFNTFKLTNENVQIPYNSSSLQQRTYSVWVNTKGFGGQNGNASAWHTWLDDGAGERILFGSSSDNVSIYPELNTVAGTRVINTWYHITYTLNGVSGPMQIYVNGETPTYAENSEFTYSPSVADTNKTTLYWMGDAGGETSFAYFGPMTIYNRVLSQTEVRQNFLAHGGRYGY